MSAYKTIISTIVDGEDVVLEFDLLSSKSVSTSSNITSHPLTNGDVIADHMYRQPVSVSISGTYSLNGNKRTIFSGTNDRLTNIQELFERIKNEGLFCSIITVNEDDNHQTRFKIRDNMVLTAIRWDEFQNSMNFSFDFVEAIAADAITAEYRSDVTDDTIPALTDPRQLDFTDTLIDWTEMYKIVNIACHDYGLFSDDFWNHMSDVGRGLAVWGGTAVAGGAIIGIAVACASNPAGWVIGAVIGIAAGIAYGISMIVKSCQNYQKKKKFKIKQFQYYEDDVKNKAEIERYANFISEIFKQIETLEDSFFLYGFSSNENQECTFYLDDNYYIFSLERSNNTQEYSLKVTDVNGKLIACQPTLTGLTNISECTSSNYLFRTDVIGSYVYIMNPSLFENESIIIPEEQRKAIKKDLTKYMILVTTIKLEEFNNMLSEIIKNAVMY